MQNILTLGNTNNMEIISEAILKSNDLAQFLVVFLRQQTSKFLSDLKT